jgi:hypothetical protein
MGAEQFFLLLRAIVLIEEFVDAHAFGSSTMATRTRE